MHIDWWTLGLQTINVLILIWLLQRFLLRPVADVIAARQAATAKSMTDAEAIKAGAVAERQKAAATAAEIASGRNAALKAAATDGDAVKAAIIADGRAEVKMLREAAMAEIDRARKEAEAANRMHIQALAIEIAHRLFERLPEEARVGGFIDGLADAIAALPPETRESIGNGFPIGLKAARALTTSEEKACAAKLSAVLGRSVDIVVIPDPDVIAGLEIESRHAIVKNSFRADLDRIAQEMSRNATDQQSYPGVAGEKPRCHRPNGAFAAI